MHDAARETNKYFQSLQLCLLRHRRYEVPLSLPSDEATQKRYTSRTSPVSPAERAELVTQKDHEAIEFMPTPRSSPRTEACCRGRVISKSGRFGGATVPPTHLQPRSAAQPVNTHVERPQA
jgi:hypothetical protein